MTWLTMACLMLALHAEARSPARELKARTYDCAGQGALAWCGTTYGLVPRALREGDDARLPEAVMLPDSVPAVHASEGRLLAATGTHGLRVFSLDDAGRATRTGAYQPLWSVVGVAAHGARAFAALGAGGWTTLTISDEGRPRPDAPPIQDTEGYVRHVLPLDERRVAVAEGRAGVSLWRLDDVGGAHLIARHAARDDARFLAWNPTRGLLAVADGRAGIALVTPPDGDGAWQTHHRIELPDMARGLCWRDDLLLVAAGSAGLGVTRVSDGAAAPAPLAWKTLPGSANKVRVVGERVLLSADHAGLTVLDLDALIAMISHDRDGETP